MNFTLKGEIITYTLLEESFYFFQWHNKKNDYARCSIDKETFNKILYDIEIEGTFKIEDSKYTLSFDTKYLNSMNKDILSVFITSEDYEKALRDYKTYE